MGFGVHHCRKPDIYPVFLSSNLTFCKVYSLKKLNWDFESNLILSQKAQRGNWWEMSSRSASPSSLQGSEVLELLIWLAERIDLIKRRQINKTELLRQLWLLLSSYIDFCLNCTVAVIFLFLIFSFFLCAPPESCIPCTAVLHGGLRRRFKPHPNTPGTHLCGGLRGS